MHHTRHLLLLSLLGAGCSPAACPAGSRRSPATGLCHLDDTSDDTPGPVDDTGGSGGTGDSGGSGGGDTGEEGSGLTLGDPILLLNTTGEPGGPGIEVIEWVEVTTISDTHAVLSGQGGAQVMSLEDGEPVGERLMVPRTYRSAFDDGVILFAGRGGAIFAWDMTDPANPQSLPSTLIPDAWGAFEDIDFAEERILLGFHDRGGVLVDLRGNEIATLPADDAYGVGLSSDHAVITDGDELVLFDLADPSAPVELDRAEMPGEGRDIDFDGTRVAVGMGGRGVGVWDVSAGTLVSRGTAALPGTSLSVSVDGDDIWVGAWQHTALLRVTDDGLLRLGLEPPVFSAMAVGARGGRAIVADWYGTQLLERVPDVAGPELELESTLRFQSGGDTARATARNWGPLPLSLRLEPPGDGFTLSTTELTVAPGDFALIDVTAPATLPSGPASVLWTSDDPDEPDGAISLRAADSGVGTPHTDFTLQGFRWPDSTLEDHSLSEQRGKVVVLAYFALF